MRTRRRSTTAATVLRPVLDHGPVGLFEDRRRVEVAVRTFAPVMTAWVNASPGGKRGRHASHLLMHGEAG